MLGTRKLPFKSILKFQRLRYQVHDRRGPRKAQDLWGGGLCSHLRGVTKNAQPHLDLPQPRLVREDTPCRCYRDDMSLAVH